MRPPVLLTRLGGWIRRGVGRRLIFWSLVFWVLAVSVVSLSFLWIGQDQLRHETRQRNIQLASVLSRDVNAQMSVLLAETRVFALRLEALGPDLSVQADALLALRLSAPQRYRAAYYFTPDGELLLHLEDAPEALALVRAGASVAARAPIVVDEAVTTAVQQAAGGAFVSGVYFSGIDRTPVLYLGRPLTLADKSMRLVVLEIDLRDIWQRIEMVTAGRTGFAYAVAADGTIIAHPQPSYLGQQVPAVLSPVTDGYEGSAQYVEPATRHTIIAAYSPVGGQTGWGIIVAQDEAEVNATVYRTTAWVASIWIGLAVVGTLGILLAVHNFMRPIVQLTQTTQNIAQTGLLHKTAFRGAPDEIGQLSHSFDRMIERLQTTEGRLAHVAAEERTRLARDLHDAVSQTLFSASLIAEVLPKIWEKDPAEGRRRLEEIRQLTRGALAEMRTLLFELRPSALADAEMGYLLHQLTESFIGRQRIPVEVQIQEECKLPAEVKVALYRIAQEALNNVAKHAQAGQARVVLSCRPEQTLLMVTDDGRGFDPQAVRPESLGLGIMRDRARDIGAAIIIESKPGAGAAVTALWTPPKKENGNGGEQGDSRPAGG